MILPSSPATLPATAWIHGEHGRESGLGSWCGTSRGLSWPLPPASLNFGVGPGDNVVRTTSCTTFDPEHRRKGIASALMGALLDAYPGSRSSRAVGRTVWRELASCRRFEARACPTTRVDASPWGKTASALSADDRGVGWGRLTPNELELLPGPSGPCWSGLEHRPKHEARIWVGAVE